MTKYIIRRLLINILLFFCITFLVYLLSLLAPGSPEEQYRTSTSTAEDLQRIRVYLGLDKPMHVQYYRWLTRMLQGDLGNSYRVNAPVTGLISQAMGPTLLLAGLSLLVSVLVALPLGALSAYKPYSVIDYISSAIAYTGIAVPGFFIGLVLIYLFAIRLGILPTGGMYYNNGRGLIKHLILPVSVVSFGMMGIFLKQTRASMLEVFNEEYVKMARAKGLREIQVVLGYVVRNAAIPVVTSIGLSIPVLISGAVIVEQLFSLPGLGKLMMQSILFRDYPVVMAVAVFISLVVLILNLLLDILYGILDPRIRENRA
jgi:peptide/nickel transport system permease protein